MIDPPSDAAPRQAPRDQIQYARPDTTTASRAADAPRAVMNSDSEEIPA
ncbi:hypothetical protein [Zhihengliuella alba]